MNFSMWFDFIFSFQGFVVLSIGLIGYEVGGLKEKLTNIHDLLQELKDSQEDLDD